jgi:hypothetical protein
MTLVESRIGGSLLEVFNEKLHSKFVFYWVPFLKQGEQEAVFLYFACFTSFVIREIHQ